MATSCQPDNESGLFGWLRLPKGENGKITAKRKIYKYFENKKVLSFLQHLVAIQDEEIIEKKWFGILSIYNLFQEAFTVSGGGGKMTDKGVVLSILFPFP